MENLADRIRGNVSCSTLGRDYHNLMRARLQRLARRIEPFRYRACANSVPLVEEELARMTGLSWRGKHTLLLTREGSWLFLGELLTELPLPADSPTSEHYTTCQTCITDCPALATVAP